MRRALIASLFVGLLTVNAKAYAWTLYGGPFTITKVNVSVSAGVTTMGVWVRPFDSSNTYAIAIQDLDRPDIKYLSDKFWDAYTHGKRIDRLANGSISLCENLAWEGATQTCRIRTGNEAWFITLP
jgi:hypothetical protein